MDKKLPKVSFIIPTLNAGWILPKCLKAIRSQNYPQGKIEIVVADGGSKDNTKKIAEKYKAIVIPNPEILHEPGKARASEIATGKILFFTDADNIISNKNWIKSMVKPYLENDGIIGFLPQTIPAPDSNSLDRYLGYLATDPFTWFMYQNAASPRTWGNKYIPLKSTSSFFIYKFDVLDHPLLGLSQGFGTVSSFKREKLGHSDDILSGIKLIEEGGLIVYVPAAGVYHYHVRDLRDFIKKYTWRVRNNYYQKIKGMGLVNRKKYFNSARRIRQFLFIPYSLTILFPLIDTIKLYIQYKDRVVLWHPIACFILTVIILQETALYYFGINRELGTYGQQK